MRAHFSCYDGITRKNGLFGLFIWIWLFKNMFVCKVCVVLQRYWWCYSSKIKSMKLLLISTLQKHILQHKQLIIDQSIDSILENTAIKLYIFRIFTYFITQLALVMERVKGLRQEVRWGYSEKLKTDCVFWIRPNNLKESSTKIHVRWSVMLRNFIHCGSLLCFI